MALVDQLRAELGQDASGKSDEQLLAWAAHASGQTPAQVANYFGYDPGSGGTWGNRIEAAWDNTKASLAGLGEAAAQSLDMQRASAAAKGVRESDQFQAQVAQERARNAGAVDDWRNIKGLGDLGSYGAGLALQAAPTLGAMAAGGLVGGPWGAAAAAYPTAVGDLLNMQRDSGDGKTNLSAAMLGGVPMTALNFAGVPGKLAGGELATIGTKALNGLTGIGGTAARLGTTMGMEAAKQGAIGLGQGVVSQAFGRGAVDPNASLTDQSAQQSYLDQAVGGAAMGSMFGMTGMGRRLEAPPTPLGDPGNTNILSNPSTSTALTVQGERSPAVIPGPNPEPYYGPERPSTAYPTDGGYPLLSGPAADQSTGTMADLARQYPNTLAVTPSGDVAPFGQLSGRQRDMFGGPETNGTEGAPPPETPLNPNHPTQSVAVPDAQTRDMLNENPTTLVRTAFNPPEQQAAGVREMMMGQRVSQLTAMHGLASNPDALAVQIEKLQNEVKQNPYSTQLTEQLKDLVNMTRSKDPKAWIDGQLEALRRNAETPGAVATVLRSQIAVRSGAAPDAYTMKLALDLSKGVGDPAAMHQYTLDEHAKLDKAMDRLDRKVSEGSDHLTPEEYAVERAKIEGKRLQLISAQDIVEGHQRDMTNAQVQEGVNKAEPGQRVGAPAPDDAASADIARERNATTQAAEVAGTARSGMDQAIKEHDARMEALQAEREKQARANMLDELLANKRLQDPRTAFTQILEKVGYDHAKLTPEEESTIANFERTHDGFTRPKERETAPPKSERTWQEERDADLYHPEETDATTPEHDEPQATETPAKEAEAAKPAELTPEAKPEEAPAKPEPKAEKPERVLKGDEKDVEDALKVYNSAAEDESPAGLRKHEKLVLDAVDYLRGTAKDTSVSRKARNRAQDILDNEVDPRDVTKAELREQTSGVSRTDPDRFSQGTSVPPESQMSKEALEKIVSSATGDHPDAPKFTILDSVNDLPVRGEVPAGPHPSGAVIDGKAYLFRAGIPDAVRAMRTVFHELFHYGLKGILGEHEYIDRMLKLQDADPLVRKYAMRWRESQEGVDRRGEFKTPDAWHAHSIEEALADISEELKTGDGLGTRVTGFVRNMAGWMADLADRLNMKGLAQTIRRMTFTDAEKFVQESLDAAINGHAKQAREGTAEPAKFSTARAEPEEEMTGPAGAPKQYWDKLKQTPMGYAIRDVMGGWRSAPWMLGWLGNDQLADRFPNMAKLQAVIKKYDDMRRTSNILSQASAGVAEKWGKLHRQDPDQGLRMSRLLNDASNAKMWIDKDNPALDKRNAHLDFQSPETREIQRRLQEQWNGLKPEYREMYTQVIDTLQTQHQAKAEALLKQLVNTYKDALQNVAKPEELLALAKEGREDQLQKIADASPGMTPDELKAVHEFISMTNSKYRPFNEIKGPYFSSRRSGDYAIVARSKGFQEMEAKLQDARKALNDLTANGKTPDAAALKAARQAFDKARDDLNDAKGNADHYAVDFVNGRSRASDTAAQWRAKLKGMDVTHEARAHFESNIDGLPPGFVDRLTAKLAHDMPGKDREQLNQALRQLVVQALPDSNMARGLKRLGVHGVDPAEALDTYKRTSHQNAWTASRLEHAQELSEHLNTLRGSDEEDERILGNEMTKRYAQRMKYTPSNALIDMAGHLSYFDHLGFSPGYYMQHLFQPWNVSAPIMAGRHGISATAKALGDAQMQVIKAMMKAKDSHVDKVSHIDLSGFSDNERQMIQHLSETDLIQSSLRSDLGIGDTTSLNPITHAMQAASNLSVAPAQIVSTANRMATALAAYRLVRQRGGEHTEALAYADKVVRQTHFDYNSDNAPRLMNSNALGGLGKLVFQFKRYQQGMVYLWGKTLSDAITTGGKLSENEHAKSLVYLTASNFALAGAAGLPVAAPLGLLLTGISKAMNDEDDKKDYTEIAYQAVKNAIGEKPAQMVRKGILAGAGLDVSGKLGFGDILSPIYRLPQAKTGQEWTGALALQLFGGTGGMISNWADAIMTYKDNPVHALEKAMPTGFAHLTEAINRLENGVTDSKGRTMIPAEEFGIPDAIAKFMGLEPSRITDMYDQRNAFMDATQGMKDVRDRLLRDAVAARMKGDGMQDVQEQISAFNERHPDEPIKPTALLSAWKTEQNRLKELKGGIRVRKQDAGIAEEYGVGQ